MGLLPNRSGSGSWTKIAVTFLALFTLLPSLAIADNVTLIQGTDANGVTRWLEDNRTPALYTGDFADCLNGESLVNVTKFDAAYYADNMTVLFHLYGSSNIRNESIMMDISVFAFGENHFNMIFNPCAANIWSLCPINASVPIEAEAIIPVSSSDVSGILPIALTIPDFEGYTTLRLYSNATQTEIGCFSARMRNSATLSHPAIISPILGAFVIAAILASFATAVYGVSIPAMRTHYAHSLSVLVVFETFQSIFLSGVLSVDWPSALAAFWSNFAWSAGMIYSPQITNSINHFLGSNLGNNSQVGGAGSTTLNNAGGLQLIYGRSLDAWEFGRRVATVDKRDTVTSSNATNLGYTWAGSPVDAGLPLPGNWSNFAGELSDLNIPVSDAFLTGLIWFLVMLLIVIGTVIIFKWSLEALARIKWIHRERLAFFRSHWKGYLGVAVLRTFFIGFIAMMTLSLFQLSFGGGAGAMAIAGITFVVFFLGMMGLAGYACFVRLRFGRYESSPDRLRFKRKMVWKFIPWYQATRASSEKQEEGAPVSKSGIPIFRIRYISNDPEKQSVHEDQHFNKRFGWLSARFRRTRWWFFAVWLVYQFVRACFLGGASQNPKAQVYGLLVVEIIALIGIVKINPYEGQRNTALATYMLGITKVITAGLSAAFLPEYNLGRIIATVVGYIIIVVQGFLTIAVLILIVLSVISSYMSLTRNREEFSPRSWDPLRMRYFGHLEKKAPDVPPPPPQPTPTGPTVPAPPYFNVNTVKRAPKIEDEDEDFLPEMDPAAVSQHSLPLAARGSRSNSMMSHHRTSSMRSNMSGYGNLPYGARAHRQSWSSRDFAKWEQELESTPENNYSLSTPISPTYEAGPSGSEGPVIHARPSSGSLRSQTPTREHLVRFADQRMSSANLNSSK